MAFLSVSRPSQYLLKRGFNSFFFFFSVSLFSLFVSIMGLLVWRHGDILRFRVEAIPGGVISL
jgi:hypothetical protein